MAFDQQIEEALQEIIFIGYKEIIYENIQNILFINAFVLGKKFKKVRSLLKRKSLFG